MRWSQRFYLSRHNPIFAVVCLLTALVLLFQLHLHWDANRHCAPQHSSTATATVEPGKLGQTIVLSQAVAAASASEPVHSAQVRC
jgi:hypothetical protein